MNQILLVGNGLTSHLIPEYENDYMMDLFSKEQSDLLDKANELFEPLRHKVDSINYLAIGWGITGAQGCETGGHPIIRSVSGLPTNPELLTLIKDTLLSIGFNNNYQKMCSTYFELYGLKYETQNKKISSIESLLKIISMFREIGKFSDEDIKHTKSLSNKIYYNNGCIRGRNIPNHIRKKLKRWLDLFSEVYTTNYDLILDDVYPSPNGVYHLHGGFLYKDSYERLTNPVSWDKAKLIWGISGDAKLSQMQGEEIGVSAQFKKSLFMEYLETLKTTQAEEIHIFGYSGENDQHINDAIINNQNIKNVVCYCSPKDVSSNPYGAEIYKFRKLYDNNNHKKVTLRSWEDVWS